MKNSVTVYCRLRAHQLDALGRLLGDRSTCGEEADREVLVQISGLSAMDSEDLASELKRFGIAANAVAAPIAR